MRAMKPVAAILALCAVMLTLTGAAMRRRKGRSRRKHS